MEKIKGPVPKEAQAKYQKMMSSTTADLIPFS